MKKILTIIVVLLSVFLIYLGFKDKDIYYFSMGDSLANGVNSYNAKDYGYADYIKDSLNIKKYVSFTNNNKRSIDFIKDIEECDISWKVFSKYTLSNIKYENKLYNSSGSSKVLSVIFNPHI